ncbi:MAG: flagellar protein FliS [Lachnospiraceae bacterium]|nr:flagellar protein FliS [Lachnospiraceae bacterium]
MTSELKKEFTLRISQANHSGLILILFDMEKVYVEDALNAYDKEDKDEYLKNINQANKVHNELMSAINPADEKGKTYLNILRYIYTKLIDSAVKRRPCELDRCQNMMDNLRIGFEKLHEIDDEGPVMKNAHQVYAGLTYGKGTLNESLSGADYSNRGFLA